MKGPTASLRSPRVLGGAGLLVIAAAAFLVLGGDEEDPSGTPPRAPAEATPSPGSLHAEWNFRVVAAGTRSATNRQRRAVADQEESITAVVGHVNDILILGEGELDELAAAASSDAARALADSPLALQPEVSEIQARRRNARIGIEVHGARHAAAISVIVADVTVNDEDVRLRYETTLWLERVRSGWKVIAYDGKRRRA